MILRRKIVERRQLPVTRCSDFRVVFFLFLFLFLHEHRTPLFRFYRKPAWLADAPVQLLKTTSARISERVRSFPLVLWCGDASLVDPSEKRSFRCRRVVRGCHVRPARRGFGGISGGGSRSSCLLRGRASSMATPCGVSILGKDYYSTSYQRVYCCSCSC